MRTDPWDRGRAGNPFQLVDVQARSGHRARAPLSELVVVVVLVALEVAVAMAIAVACAPFVLAYP